MTWRVAAAIALVPLLALAQPFALAHRHDDGDRAQVHQHVAPHQLVSEHSGHHDQTAIDHADNGRVTWLVAPALQSSSSRATVVLGAVERVTVLRTLPDHVTKVVLETTNPVHGPPDTPVSRRGPPAFPA